MAKARRASAVHLTDGEREDLIADLRDELASGCKTDRQICLQLAAKHGVNPETVYRYIGDARDALRAAWERDRDAHAAFQLHRLLTSIDAAKRSEDFAGQAALERVVSRITGTEVPVTVDVHAVTVDATARAVHERLLELAAADDGERAIAHEVELEGKV